MEDDIHTEEFNDYKYQSDIERIAITGIASLLDDYYGNVTDSSKYAVINKIRTLLAIIESSIRL